ncbi:MAG TPA: 16S rRNA (guanine(966)-N(2))-methyltransferase RsmD [Proteobacteria bacterium]|nr:16S rRNA (guanine(966)-N(2))-methyltransferase RsmD [Pseudomonadota bacterium]
MRISGGHFKGRKVSPVNSPGVRPSKAIVREALFSILGPSFCDGKVIGDLFSGSGIMAIEALSRGAAKVFCVDYDTESCSLIRANLALLEISCNALVLQMRIESALNYFRSNNIILDLVYLDPPYINSEDAVAMVDLACSYNILAQESYTVIEHRRSCKLPDSQFMSVVKQKCYGQSQLTFLKLKS